MKYVALSLFITALAFALLLFILNLIRYLKTSYYYKRYLNNCIQGKYDNNLLFYRHVKHLFEKAKVSEINPMTHRQLYESLDCNQYVNSLKRLFAKTKSTFHYNMFAPWYILDFPKKGNRSFKNFLPVSCKTVFYLLFSYFLSKFLDDSGLGDAVVFRIISFLTFR